MMPEGSEIYNVDAGSVVARGVQLSDTEYSRAMQSILPIVSDEEGTDLLREGLSPLAMTGFMQDNLQRLLTSPAPLEDWRIGEAIAEKYLADHHQCEFPWPGGRDQKNPNSSTAGCDLVGFQHRNGSVRFSFGEVKTSYQAAYPPSVVTSRHGLADQITDLRDNEGTKDALVRYLYFHAQNASWLTTCKQAAERYLADPEDVSLYGILIRDVAPNQLDLRAKARSLSQNCPVNTSIELRALYMPIGKIPSFADDVRRIRGGRTG